MPTPSLARRAQGLFRLLLVFRLLIPEVTLSVRLNSHLYPFHQTVSADGPGYKCPVVQHGHHPSERSSFLKNNWIRVKSVPVETEEVHHYRNGPMVLELPTVAGKVSRHLGASQQPGPCRHLETLLRCVLPSFLVLAIQAACSRSTEAPGHSFQIREENGSLVAATSGGPKFEEELFAYEFLFELRGDEREESLLFQPTGFLMDEEGFFYVADYGNDRIAVFDPRGGYERAIGREGEGPGEFQWVQIPEVRNGILTVIDPVQNRVSRFQTDGQLIEVIDLPPEDVISPVRGYWVLPGGGHLLFRLDETILPVTSGDVAAVVSMFGVGGDTLWTHRTPKVLVRENMEVQMMGVALPVPTPILFGSAPRADYHPDFGLMVSSGEGSEFYYLDIEGEVSRKVVLGLTPEAPTQEEKQTLLDAVQRKMEETDNPSRNALYEALLTRLEDLPEEKAFWKDVYIDDSGFVWLQIPDPMEFLSEDRTPRFRIVSPEGEYLGNTTAPTGSSWSPSHGHLLVQYNDPETDLRRLAVYSIRPMAEGLIYP